MKMYLKFLTMHNSYKSNNLSNHGHSKMTQWVKDLVFKSFNSWDPHGRRKEITMQKSSVYLMLPVTYTQTLTIFQNT